TASLTNNGLIELSSVNTPTVRSSTLSVTGATLLNNVTGTIEALPGTGGARSVSVSNGTLSNSGVIDVTQAPLSVNLNTTAGTFSNSGTLSFGSGGNTLTFSNGTVINASTASSVTGTSTGTLSFQNDTVKLNADLTLNSSVSVLISNPTTVNGPGTLTN